MDSTSKLVSVVVQAYNSADTIERTLDSVCAQTYSNIELIITDDLSKDNTLEVAADWIKQHKGALTKIKLVTADVNTGISGSNNRALKQVTGKYAIFLAADDYMTPDAIQEYFDFCEKNTGVIPIAKVVLFSEENCDFSSVQEYCNRCYVFAQLDQKAQYRKLLVQNRIVSPAASFYPVKLLRKLKGFDEAYRWMEDYPINLRILKRGYRFGFLDKQLIYYRISAGSITSANQIPLKKTEAKLFFRQKFWYMVGAGMGWEAIKQSKSWIKVLFLRGK